MLDGLAPLVHLVGMLVEPALHRFENVLMLRAGDPSLMAVGQLCLMAQLRQNDRARRYRRGSLHCHQLPGESPTE